MQDFADYNYTALFRKFSRQEVQAFNKGRKLHENPLFPVIVVIAGMVYSFIFVITIVLAAVSSYPAINLLILIATTVAIPIAARSYLANGNSAELRFIKFAEENGLLYIRDVSETYATSTTLAYNGDGAVFDVGSERKFDHMVGNQRFAVGGYRYTTGSGKNRSTHYWQVATIRISKNLPHILFDAKRNNFIGFSNLPRVFKQNQLITSEAEFDETFNLYAPEGFTIDALSFIAPDFMYVMNLHFADYDVEIIDSHVVIYKAGRLQPLSVPPLMKRLKLVADELEDNISSYNASLKPIEAADRQARGRRLQQKQLSPIFGGGIAVFYLLTKFIEFQLTDLILVFPIIFIVVIVVRVVRLQSNK